MKTTYEKFHITGLQKNIIIGSLLGDGSLALYGRSTNAYSREHSCIKQLNYRQWKCNLLKDLHFKIRSNKNSISLICPSHPIYTNLYNKFYINKIKTLTNENIELITHPIALACFYGDDGSLVIEASKKSNKIYIFPRIYISTLNFSKEENTLLINYIKNRFNINFKLKYSPYGYKNILELGKRNEVYKFIKLIKPYFNEIDCMKYKIDLSNRMIDKYNELIKNNSKESIIISPLKIKENTYTKTEEDLIVKLKMKGFNNKTIANKLNRSYYGIVDKIRRLKKENKL